jgi:hypothetical protein
MRQVGALRTVVPLTFGIRSVSDCPNDQDLHAGCAGSKYVDSRTQETYDLWARLPNRESK